MRVRLPLTLLSLSLLMAVLLMLPAGASQGITPGYDLEFSRFLQSQGAMIQPSVVVVETRFTRMIHDNGNLREITVEGDFATGFFYNDSGVVVTEYRAVMHGGSEPDYIMVRLADGRQYDAEVVGYDGPTAIAVLQVRDISPSVSLPIPIGDATDVIVGEPIMFLGYNWISRSRISYDFGVISALRPKFPTIEESTNQYFQINVPQNSGNEGGVVVNANGEVIAIMTDIAPYRDATEIHFGLPIDVAVEIIDAILDEGEMHRPWFGFRLLEMNPQIERAYTLISDMDGDGLITSADRDLFLLDTGFDLNASLFVVWVDEDSPANDAGLREGDILMEFNGVPITNMDELSNQIERYRIGDRVTIEWMRREYSVWDPYVAEMTMEYSGQRDEEEEE